MAKERRPVITSADAAQRAAQPAENAMRETFAAFGEGFEPAWNQRTTSERIAESLVDDRKDTPASQIQPWECRLGGSTFFVPPININVSQTFKSGTMTGAAIRQQSSPKFNTGHTETLITMTVYFPTYEDIMGFEDQVFHINFDTDPDWKIDSFLSSMRGLIAQFKYAPFLPIKNTYLNQTFGITGVGLKDLTFSTVPGFPFCLSAQLTLVKFNHKAFLPMIDHFDNAIHWGRFRQYMGRAAGRLAQASKPIKTFSDLDSSLTNSTVDVGEIQPSVRSAQSILDDSHVSGIPANQRYYRHGTNENASNYAQAFDFYFPLTTPARLDLPDLRDMRPDDNASHQRKKSWWQNLLSVVGIDVNTIPEAHYDAVRAMAEEKGTGYVANVTETKLLFDFLKTVNLLVEEMSVAEMNKYYNKRIAEKGIKPGTAAAREFYNTVQTAWIMVMYRRFMEQPTMARKLANESQKRKQLTINEWELPMWKLELDLSTATINGISVTMGNVLARLQLQMQDEPTHQHIGGADTRIDISMTVAGENAEREIIKLRTMFENISGLARLEHGHGVLGFLGVQSAITSLCGVRYVIPLSFEVDTVPNFPHVYDVRISLTDFDVFQQKREILSAEQQAELVAAFGKRNPFLRLKQLWGMYNAYPDFPLSVRDNKGKIVGHLDPDYYFRSFKMIDDDLVESSVLSKGSVKNMSADAAERRTQKQVDLMSPSTSQYTGANFQEEPGTVNFCVGTGPDGKPQYITINDSGKISIYDGETAHIKDGTLNEAHAGNTINVPNVEGLTPASAYVEPYFGGSGDPTFQFDMMARDMQYRDKGGRLIKAFPTYMLWLIDEGGNFAGMKMFDNFYGLQSVIDMSIVQSEDILGDTLVLRLSNLYSRLSTKFHDYLDENDPASRMINQVTRRFHRQLTGTSEQLVQLDTMELRPGIRVHLRLGYGSDPNKLDTVFNGTITEVQTGEIMTVVCQSDAMELSAMVNTTNEKGHTGKIDGAMLGLYMSEPRDLMITLLTQGSSVAKEVIAHATRGEIFSENRYGISHFGKMMYTTLDYEEIDKQGRQKDKLSTAAMRATEGPKEGVISVLLGFDDEGYNGIARSLFVNLATKRDYEIFKRNIYPGNGTGVAQYMGGDIGDIGLSHAIGDGAQVVQGTGVTANGEGLGGESDAVAATQAAIDAQAYAGELHEAGKADGARSVGAVTGLDEAVFGPTLSGIIPDGLERENFIFKSQKHNLLEMMGITNPNDDDGPFNEYVFRAQTYMKTVWDLFKICAALLPDYIVAVRPFEDRSTVFYGKPHWLYTSGVIPITTGVSPKDGAPVEEPDSELRNIYEEVEKYAAERDAIKSYQEKFAEASGLNGGPSSSTSADPTLHTGGMEIASADELLKNYQSVNYKGVPLPYTEGLAGLEMHLPTDANLENDKAKHKQLPDLPPEYRHPFYMDRQGGARGGRQTLKNRTYDPNGPTNQAILGGEDANVGGQTGASGYLDPDVEQWYMCMLWKMSDFKGARILVYCPGTKRAVVTVAAERGPAADVTRKTGKVCGVSPDVYWALGKPSSQKVHFRVMPDNTPIGPVNIGALSQAPAATVPGGVLTDAEKAEGKKEQPLTEEEKKAKTAKDIAGDNRSEPEAVAIWKEVREYLPTDNEMRDTFLNSPGLKDLSADNKKRAFDTSFPQVVENYIKFLWDDPAARGWVVKVVNKRLEGGAGLVEGAVDVIGGNGTSFSSNFSRNWDLGKLYEAFNIYINEGNKPTLEWMMANAKDGKDATGAMERVVESFGAKVHDVASGVWGALKSVGSTIKNIVQYLKLQLAQLMNGLKLQQGIQQQSNALNRIFNDSIYYSAGRDASGKVVNRLLYYADNPFTREYAEPVVEIRQPFQRMHTIGSFGHIINNGITETVDDVYTVVTATSNGKHPVTVHFDKGMASEHQWEKVVDTGLFWDAPDGVKDAITNPVKTLRHTMTTLGFGRGQDAVSTETSAKRVALWHLKESLKDIYQGELMILGDASIRPHDLVYLGDVFERMYGFFEVEQVIHHFTPETGFVTAITPNACVTINDPARFSMIARMRAKSDIASVREHIQSALHVTADGTQNSTGFAEGPTAQNLEEMSVNELAEMAEVQIKNSLQYTGGSSQLIAGMTSMVASGGLVAGAAGAVVVGLGPAAIVGGIVGWAAWKWVRDNLLDQHGCMISYLTKNGRPMNAGLGYAQGTAVGHQNGIGIVIKGLKIAEISTVGPDGHARVRTQDVIKGLSWDEKGPSDNAAQVDFFVDQTIKETRRIALGENFSHAFLSDVYWAKIVDVIDGDTIHVQPMGHVKLGSYTSSGNLRLGNNRIRLASVGVAEDPFKGDPVRSALHPDDPGVRRTAYTREVLLNKEVALKIIRTEERDQYDRTLAYIFHNAPEHLTYEERRGFILNAAAGVPSVDWDAYISDGQPYTFNWQLVAAGLGDIYTNDLKRSRPGRGVRNSS